MKILIIHGVGHQEASVDWQAKWEAATVAGLGAWGAATPPVFDYFAFDRRFEEASLNSPVVLTAMGRLVASGLFYGISDRLRSRGFFSNTLESMRWTAGMVAQWVGLDGLRRQLRADLARKMASFQPDVVLAHSLGSLIAYDTFRENEAKYPSGAMIQDVTLVTFGSQIGNAAVRSVFGGRVEQLETARFWWHLFNPEDAVFTCPINLPSRDKFRQVDTPFDLPGMMDHDGTGYLGDDETVAVVWQDIASTIARRMPARERAALAARPGLAKLLPAATSRLHARKVKGAARRPRTRAVLVGIGDYPDPDARLDGPVNDVFSMSAALQELGFSADDIRVVLNDRATNAAIRERLEWLLGDARNGDRLVFFFAGHGAQIAGYGAESEVDRLDECLAPWDFEWSKESAFTDDEFAALYSQLPYDCQFTAVLDCCHSGGMTRAAGARVRGLTPPDDIRHRMLRWDARGELWVPRDPFRKLSEKKSKLVSRREDQGDWTGSTGSRQRMGRGTSLWAPTDREFRAAKSAKNHEGPYVPVTLEACAEGELAYEYRHGVVSHGAFTYILCGVLRQEARTQRKRPLNFTQLIEETRERMATVVAERQTPQLNAAAHWREAPIPGFHRRR